MGTSWRLKGKSTPGSVDLLLKTSLRWTFGGSSGTGIGSVTAGGAVLVHLTYFPTHVASFLPMSILLGFVLIIVNNGYIFMLQPILADIATLISYFCIMKRFITDGIDFDWYPSFYCTRSRSVRSLAAGLLWLRAIRALGPWEVAWELFFSFWVKKCFPQTNTFPRTSLSYV